METVKVSSFITLTLLLIGQVHCAKILTVAFVSSKSHQITYERLLHELGARGHNVTVLSPIPTKESTNVKHIMTLGPNEDSTDSRNFFEMKEQEENMHPFLARDVFGKICESSYDLPQVKAVLNEKFDLVIMPALVNECTAGFVYKLNTSLILVSSISASSWLTHFTGGSSPPSFVPNAFSRFTQKMCFFERVLNFLIELKMLAVYNFYFAPGLTEIYRQKLNDSSLPSSFDIIQNASLVLSNGHFALGSPKPYLPDIVEVAGMHCEPAKALPADLENFINGAGDHGFIYFSMGSAIRGSTLPETKRKMFLEAFSKLKQLVLWKWETESMEGLPGNVKLGKWFPQQDLLGHGKLRVFITHGGFGSTTESVYHGVPLVGIPINADQELNLQLAENKGFAIRLNFNSLTAEVIEKALKNVIFNTVYKGNAVALSKILRDQPQPALDRAVFWTEYVIRHKGATHLRSAARDLNFFQYYSLDVIGFLLTSLFSIVYMIFALVSLSVRMLRRTVSKSEKSKKKNQ